MTEEESKEVFKPDEPLLQSWTINDFEIGRALGTYLLFFSLNIVYFTHIYLDQH